MDHWPQSLRTAVGICLNSPFPMFVWWGPDLINIYNDAYAPVLGKRHPDALGQPARQIWAEIWPVIGEDVDRVIGRGEAVSKERVRFVMERNGYPEETFFTYSHSPIPDEHGGIGGLFQVCTDETDRVRAERERDRLAAQRQLALDAARLGWWHYDPVTKLATFDERYAEIVGVAGRQRPNEEILKRLHPDDRPGVWAKVEAALDPADPKPYSAEFRVVHDDGSVRWVEAHGAATFDGAGPARRATSFVGTVADITDRKRVADQTRTILESITDAFFALDRDWRFTYVNPQAERVLGRAPGELIGRVLWDEYTGLVGSEFEHVYRHAANERAAGSVTAFYPDHDRWYEVHAYPAPGGGISIYFRDVTDRKRAEELLAAQNRALEIVAGAAPLDEALGALVRLVEEQSGGQSVASILLIDADDCSLRTGAAPSLPPEYNAAIDGIKAAHGVGTCCDAAARNEVVVTPDIAAAPSWAGLSHLPLALGLKAAWSTPIRASDGRVLGTFGTYLRECREPTRRERQVVEGLCRAAALAIERRQAEVAQRESDRRLRQMADAMPQMVWVTLADGYHEYYNRRWYEFTGVPEGSTDGEGWNEMFHPDDRERAWATWRHCLETGEPYEIEYRLRHRSGEYRWTLGRALPVRNARGEVERWFGTCTDIHTLKQLMEERESLLQGERAARAEAERQGRMKDDFLATLSHEIRTPLNAIVGWSQILRNGTPSSEDLNEGLAAIDRNARAQTQIIEDLLDMSRIVLGKIRLDVQRVDLAAVVQAAVDTMRPAADAKGIRLHAVIDPNADGVHGDPGRLHQVFWNLISNAIKFTPRGGQVRVLLERVNSHLEVGVIDTGEGIRPEFLPHVFDRFRQADASTTRRHGGLGLGLSIVKQLVELHGGTVTVSSDGLGRGTTFVVALPLSSVTHASPEPQGERRHPGGGLSTDLYRDACVQLSGLRVLVVDDEPDARAVVKRLLEDCDATVSTAASADEAVSMLQSQRPDVLVSDIGMPGEDGYSLIRRVRALGQDRGGDTPALALTAYARAEDRVRAVRAGFQTHVVKPVEPAELITMVASLAGRTR